MAEILQYQPTITESDIKAVEQYLRSGGFITEFKQSRNFEKALSELIGSKHSILFPNGTLTLFAILKCLDLPSGSEVIVPNYTMAATAFAVTMAGFSPIFCDVEPSTLNISIDSVSQILSSSQHSVSALIYVSANGRYPSYDINNLIQLCKEHKVEVVEDAAQSLRSYFPDKRHIGTAGIAGSFSFSMPKILTTGQGGLVVTNCDQLAANLQSFRDFGRAAAGTDIHDSVGLNLKFTDLQAIIGLSQLSRIDQTAEVKISNYKRLHDLISTEKVRLLPNDLDFTVPWFYEVICEDRQELISHLSNYSIQSRPMYPELNKQSCYAKHPQSSQTFPVSQNIAENGLWLPSHASLETEDIDYIAKAINEF